MPEKSMDNYLEEIDKCLYRKENPNEPNIRSIQKHILNRNKEGARDALDNLLKSVFKGSIHDLLENNEFLFGGFHYICHSMGEWFRFNLSGTDDFFSSSTYADLVAAQRYYIEETYKKVPKELHLCTMGLKRPLEIIVSFSDSDPITPAGFEGLVVANSERRSLSKTIEESDNYFDYLLGGKYAKNNPNENDYLAPHERLLDRFKECLSPCGLVSANDNHYLFRLLTFSLYYTLHIIEPEKLATNKSRSKILRIIIIPFPCCYELTEEDLSLGGFYGAFANTGKDINIASISRVAEHIVNRLLAHEFAGSKDQIRDGSVLAEDIIRKCAQIDANIVNKLSLYEQCFNDLLPDDCPDNMKGIIKGIVKNLCGKGFIGANPRYIALLKKIFLVIQEEFRNGFYKETEINNHCPTIYFHGDPGIGKEILPKFCHLLNPRFYHPDYLAKIIKPNKTKFSTIQARVKDKEWCADNIKQEVISTLSSGKNDFDEIFSKQDKEVYLFGNVNASDLDKDVFSEDLFGGIDREGRISKLSTSGGTLFIDEINTMNPELGNKFLKVVEKPYQYYPVKAKDPNHANILLIFGSNMSPQELLAAKFNPAFVYRITQNAFKIPPLRERKEDIALFVNKKISDRNDSRSAEDQVKSIDYFGLRLICELNWGDNYRGLNGFVNDIFTDRMIRSIKTSEITFDEIVKCIKRRDILDSKSGSAATKTMELKIV